ncbi:hypothetical protein KTN05_05695 [Paracoccus sp. Z118]|uniref:hypothetical protein n=1 Tax=Paracoccus sp. Z118 TaxID=2851017 RepID=UPI001C2C6638|nr:hypothetical protein [Paracoccus sp. Z118]MBV0891345.1 hypothetical protein [Paracoccus sp. Z118]
MPLTCCGYWGTLNYAHIWLSVDAMILGELRKDGGVFTKHSLSETLRLYSVRRGFPSLEKDTNGRDISAVVELVNEKLCKVPEELEARAEQCIELAKDMQIIGLTVGRQVSAATKLSWFLSPDNWTVYDSYAARALGVADPKKFYAKLQGIGGNTESGFATLCSAIGTSLEASEWSQLRPARIIDGILLNLGSMGSNARDAISQRRAAQLAGLVEGLPKSGGDRLMRRARSVQTQLDELGLGTRLQ